MFDWCIYRPHDRVVKVCTVIERHIIVKQWISHCIKVSGHLSVYNVLTVMLTLT